MYNHLHNGSGADYQAPAEYDHLDRGPAGGQAYEVALPDAGAGGSSRYVRCAALLHHGPGASTPLMGRVSLLYHGVT